MKKFFAIITLCLVLGALVCLSLPKVSLAEEGSNSTSVPRYSFGLGDSSFGSNPLPPPPAPN